MREPRLGVGACIVNEGRLLLFRRLREPDAGCWSIPGGKVDFLEPIEEGLRREVAEETGLVLGALRLLCVTDQIYPDVPEHWVAPTYLATSFTGEAVNREPHKHEGMDWFALDNLPAPLSMAVEATMPALKRALG
ncbi:MAG: NUDIX domain-containing protein [Caulobacter sp.]|nr:NUDIX domain-containing protein [Caulobacter sp.]